MKFKRSRKFSCADPSPTILVWGPILCLKVFGFVGMESRS